ncbi:MAG: hypothetical protein QM780_13170 [Hyphomicrobium sp.]
MPRLVGAAVDVVPCTALSETPAAVGANCGASGFKSVAAVLDGSISS